MTIKSTIKSFIPDQALDAYHDARRRVNYNHYRSLPPERIRNELMKWYHKVTGEKIDLENPQTLNEKIQWLKLWDCTPEKGVLADKYSMRPVVDKVLGPGHVTPLLGVWDSFDDINFDDLPNQYVLKTTLGSGTNVFVTKDSPLDRASARSRIKGWLETDFSFVNGFELHYGYGQNRVIAETYMDFGEEDLVDFRFYCSYGKVFSIWVDTGSATHQYHRTVFTPDWEALDVRATHPKHEVPPRKPALFDYMFDAAEKLSEHFSLVRVDFYEWNGRAMVGELTFTPMSGITVFDPPSFNRELGEAVTLPASKKPYKGILL